MLDKVITENLLKSFELYLYEEEKSAATINKYLGDVRKFIAFAGNNPANKQLMLDYKAFLEKNYKAKSANSMLAALNAFLSFAGWEELRVKYFKVQKQVYSPEEKELTKEEYIRLVRAAEHHGNDRLSLILQTICSTGIRVSELEYITVESLKKGEAHVSCKGKERVVFIVKELRSKLLRYTKRNGVKAGPVFVTKSGRPMNRCNIWKEMKSLCKEARVSRSKVFPHNLRHLFAKVFYEIEKDIAKLADILGHTSINTTRIYIMTTGAEHRRKMELMKLIL